MGFIFDNAWLIPGLPFISFLIVGLGIRPYNPRLAGVVATIMVFLSAACAWWLAFEYFSLYAHGHDYPTLVTVSYEWLRYQEHLTANVGVLVDPTSLLLMIVVTTVSSLVHLYSLGYMHGDEGIGRFFTYLNLFTFSMLGLVVAPNILQLFVCWELVGSTSFLLIGYYYTKPSAVSASKKAFVVTRFADLGFLVGILLLGYYGYNTFVEFTQTNAALLETLSQNSGRAIQPFDFLFINHPEALQAFAAQGESLLGVSLLTLAMIAIFCGCAGKSAMFPLHIWLPDAMEGPTPVSALIHAATMVVAGVYLVARLFPSFAFSMDALLVVAYIGAFTCLFAAVIGCTQDDIKRVLAFSTLSQLGYMMFSLGVAEMQHSLGYTASLFHLFTHAFFKALLFLGAGAVIHAVHSNSIWDMGGLKKKMPITHITFLIATLAIAGVPPLAGFFSKDEILAAALGNHFYLIFGTGLFVGGLTAFYMFRIYFVTFQGQPRTEQAEHAHEAPLTMTIPLMVLAVLSMVAGFIPIPNWVQIGEPLHHHGINLSVAIPATIAALCGIGVAWFLYMGPKQRVEGLVNSMGKGYTTIKNKFYIDEVYLFVTHKIIFNLISRPIAWFDRNVVDGGVNLGGWVTQTLGAIFSRSQTGQVQTYGTTYVVGSVAVMLLLYWLAV